MVPVTRSKLPSSAKTPDLMQYVITGVFDYRKMKK